MAGGQRSPAQIRAAAQRKLAKDLKAGTFKPSGVGKKAREVANSLKDEKKALIREIQQYKNSKYGGRNFNQKRSDENVEFTPLKAGKRKRRSIEELRIIADVIQQIKESANPDDFDWAWDNLFEDADYESAFYYH